MTPKKRRLGITRRRLTQYIEVVFAGRSTEFAKFVGMGQSTISRIVTGDRQEPRLKTIQRIATGMGTQMAWLTGDEDVFEGDNFFAPEWYNMLTGHWRVATRKEVDFLKSIEGTSDDAESLIELGRELADNPAPLAGDLYAQFPPHSESRRIVEPFIRALRAELEGAWQNLRLIVTELKKRDDVHEKRG